MFRVTQPNVPTIAATAVINSTLDRDREPTTMAWEALLQARDNLKSKRRYRLWHRLNKRDE